MVCLSEGRTSDTGQATLQGGCLILVEHTCKQARKNHHDTAGRESVLDSLDGLTSGSSGSPGASSSEQKEPEYASRASCAGRVVGVTRSGMN